MMLKGNSKCDGRGDVSQEGDDSGAVDEEI